MSNTISWNLQMSVREGRLNDARELMSEMVAGTQQEPGTQGYEWFLMVPERRWQDLPYQRALC
jgi:quinol monooxygenase YgiN